MSIKNLVEIYNQLKGMDISQAMSDEAAGLASSAIKELSDVSDVAKNTILEKMAEKDFVRFLTVVQKITVVAGLAKGDGYSVMAAMADGSLTGYTHTVIMAVIGALIQDEIL